MQKTEYYINVKNGKLNGKYPKVSGYVGVVTDVNGGLENDI